MSQNTPPFFQRQRVRSLGVALALLAASAPWAVADTRLERDIAQEPSPHQSLGQGEPRAQVHWARRMEQQGDDALNQQRLDQMRDDVQTCIKSNQERGQPVKQIHEWPSRQYRNRRDSYVGHGCDALLPAGAG